MFGIFKRNKIKKAPTQKRIVPWNEYYPNIETASTEIKSFYKYWLKKFRNGEYIDLGENLSYVFGYIYSLINDFIETKDINYLRKEFNKLSEFYGHTKVKSYLDSWLEDAYLHIKDYRTAWELEKSYPKRIDDFLFYSSMLNESVEINGKEFIELIDSSYLTQYGKENIEEIERLSDLFLKDFHLEKGMNFIDYFCRDIKKARTQLTEDDIFKYKDFYIEEEDFYNYKKIDDQQIKTGYKKGYINYYNINLFQGVIKHIRRESKITDKVSVYFGYPSPSFIEIESESIELGHTVKNALLNKGRKILRECENTLREEKGIPKIGEGWVSETELYHKLVKSFPNEEIIHHGRPKWLGRQHLDIFFPELNIGIEYQGEQHQEPVEYFGGEEAFIKQQKRDVTKKRKCKKNDCELMYVLEGYDLQGLKDHIEFLIEKKKKE